jgi:hypothetical protein
MDQIAGHIPFVDSITRPVYQQSDGRQYVRDDGNPVFGVWIIPEAEAESLAPDVVVISP